MKDKIYNLFVEYKRRYRNSPSFGYLARQLGLTSTGIKYHVDRDDRYEWLDDSDGGKVLCLRDGTWDLKTRESATKQDDTGTKS